MESHADNISKSYTIRLNLSRTDLVPLLLKKKNLIMQMKITFLLFMLMHIHVTSANGKPLNLECTFSPQNVQNVSRRWTGGLKNRLLCFNGVTTDPSKYKETTVSNNTYTLQIRETSEDDLECPYSCRFGFQSDERILHVTEDNFIYLPNENTTKIEYGVNKENYTLLLEIIKVFPEPVCGIPIKDTLRNLTKVKESKGRIFYHLSYELESSESLHACGSQLEIKCTIGNTLYTFYRPHDLSCTAFGTIKSKIVYKVNIAIVITLAALVVIIFILYNIKQEELSQRRYNRNRDSSTKTNTLGGLNHCSLLPNSLVPCRGW